MVKEKREETKEYQVQTGKNKERCRKMEDGRADVQE